MEKEEEGRGAVVGDEMKESGPNGENRDGL